MGKSAKNYKRPTKKEKIGLSATQARDSYQKNMQRHAPISAQLTGKKPLSRDPNVALKAGNTLDIDEDTTMSQPKTAVEMEAQKLLLEAEKRALMREKQAENGMDEDMASNAPKKKTGAAGLKAKAKQAMDASSNGPSSASKKVDYVDLFDGRRSSKP